MISVIYSTREDNQKHLQHIKDTCGVHKMEVIQYINNGEYSLTELYNKALQETTNNIVVFCHDDIIFETNNWGRKILKHFKRNPEYGILGVAGSTYLPKSGKWWEIPYSMKGIVNHKNDGKKWESRYSKEIGNSLYDVTLVDGLFFCVDKNKIKKSFDENVKGFHFYDINFCFDNFNEGVKIGVLTDVRLTHLSIGETNEEWDKNRIKFSETYVDKLPISTHKCTKNIETYIVCHSQEIIESYIKSEKFKDVNNLKYIFVGFDNCDKLRDFNNVIIAKDYEENLEEYPNFTAFTAWYLLWKNNLIKSDYVNLLEYDVMLSDNFTITNEMVIDMVNPNIIGYVPFDMRNYHFINNPDWVQTIFRGIIEVYKIDMFKSISNLINVNKDKMLVWSSTSNILFNVETFNNFMKWFEPLIPYLKQDKNAGHAFERSITFFSLMNKVQCRFIPNTLKHIQMDSHKTQGHFVNNEEEINKLVNGK